MDRLATDPRLGIEHKEGVIVVDTGQAAHLLRDAGNSLHPYLRWEFRSASSRSRRSGRS